VECAADSFQACQGLPLLIGQVRLDQLGASTTANTTPNRALISPSRASWGACGWRGYQGWALFIDATCLPGGYRELWALRPP